MDKLLSLIFGKDASECHSVFAAIGFMWSRGMTPFDFGVQRAVIKVTKQETIGHSPKQERH